MQAAAHVQVAYRDTGEVVAADIELIGNAGWNLDYSHVVILKALSHMDGVYRIPNLRFFGRMCRTNQCSNTAMRGLGAPQARTSSPADAFMSPAARATSGGPPASCMGVPLSATLHGPQPSQFEGAGSCREGPQGCRAPIRCKH